MQWSNFRSKYFSLIDTRIDNAITHFMENRIRDAHGLSSHDCPSPAFTIEEVMELSFSDIEAIRNLGRSSQRRLARALSEYTKDAGWWSVEYDSPRLARKAPVWKAAQGKDAERHAAIQMGHPCIYATLLPVLRERARELGYALGLHGSMTRDLDLIAVPWVEEAVSGEWLVRSLQEVLGGYFVEGGSGSIHAWVDLKPGQKPHGRVAYTLRFGGDKLLIVDLSVMPRVTVTSNLS